MFSLSLFQRPALDRFTFLVASSLLSTFTHFNRQCCPVSPRERQPYIGWTPPCVHEIVASGDSSSCLSVDLITDWLSLLNDIQHHLGSDLYICVTVGIKTFVINCWQRFCEELNQPNSKCLDLTNQNLKDQKSNAPTLYSPNFIAFSLKELNTTTTSSGARSHFFPLAPLLLYHGFSSWIIHIQSICSSL